MLLPDVPRVEEMCEAQHDELLQPRVELHWREKRGGEIVVRLHECRSVRQHAPDVRFAQRRGEVAQNLGDVGRVRVREAGHHA